MSLTIPNPDLSHTGHWYLRLASTSLFALPLSMKSPASTPTPSFRVYTARDGSVTDVLTLMPLSRKHIPKAYYTGTFKLPSDAYSFELDGIIHADSAADVIALEVAINNALATAVKLEYHTDGHILSVPIGGSLPKRGTVVRDAGRDLLCHVKVVIGITSRDWYDETAGVSFGVIF